MLKLWGSKLHGIKDTFAIYDEILRYIWFETQLNKLVTLIQKVGNWDKKLVISQVFVNLKRPIILCYVKVMWIKITWN